MVQSIYYERDNMSSDVYLWRLSLMEFDNKERLIEINSKCLEIREIVERTELLQRLNILLPLEYRILLPSFVTSNYIDQKLYLLEEKFSEKS